MHLAPMSPHGNYVPERKSNGDEGDRTLNLLVANQALSQLSYVPAIGLDSTVRHGDYLAFELTTIT